MENGNEFSWANANASHAVLMCEIEGGIDWHNTTRIDWISQGV